LSTAEKKFNQPLYSTFALSMKHSYQNNDSPLFYETTNYLFYKYICGASNQIIMFIHTFEKIFSQVLLMIQNWTHHFSVEWKFLLFKRFATQVNYKVKFVGRRRFYNGRTQRPIIRLERVCGRKDFWHFSVVIELFAEISQRKFYRMSIFTLIKKRLQVLLKCLN